jgi:hypothetical protein
MAFGQYLGYIGGVIGAIIGGVIGTYVFPAVGTGTGALWGYSIGSMVGGVAGQVFWPEHAELNLPPPPQPHETRLQFSSWGAAIPIQYGEGRLAGNIIYMSDIVETIDRSRHRQDGVRYYEMVRTYTATFAIAFCEGPVPGVARIWMNNKVIADWRDPLNPNFPSGGIGLASINLETSVARSETFFSSYLGSESQEADSYLVALIGTNDTPAYRGLCYIVFRDFPIGEFSGVPTMEIEIGETNNPVDFMTWNASFSGLPNATRSHYEVHLFPNKSGYYSDGCSIYPTSISLNSFNLVFEIELISMTPGIWPDTFGNYAHVQVSQTSPYNFVQFRIGSHGAGQYRFAINMDFTGGASAHSYGATIYTTLPIKRYIHFSRNSTTCFAKIFNGATLEEEITLTDARFTASIFNNAQIGALLQVDHPAIDFYVRNLYVDAG